jgi:hypothetical protein
MRKTMRRIVALAGLALVAVAALPSTALGATPASGTLGKRGSTTWEGGPFTASNPAGCVGAFDPSCDHYTLTVNGGKSTAVRVAITAADGQDFDLFVYDEQGREVARSAGETGNEIATIPAPASGAYEVRVQPWLVTPGATYTGVAQVTRATTTAPPASDEERDCLEAVPASVGVSGVTDGGQIVSLDVVVLLDGVDQAKAAAVMARAADSYSPAGIALDVVRYEVVSFTGTDGAGLIQQAKDHFGGFRPAGSDLVYVLSSKDLTNATNGSGLAGLADCIGGVKYPEHAFAVGEVFADENLAWNGFTLYADATAKIAAHELGHLMGAHHHYANCAETATAEDVNTLSPCSLMFNFVDFQGIEFSIVNRAVVRGHAVDFASP